MADKKTKAEIEALKAQIEADQAKPVREHERRVRIGDSFKGAVKQMSDTPPISNQELKEWSQKQKENLEEK
jgi:hypothetical protein